MWESRVHSLLRGEGHRCRQEKEEEEEEKEEEEEEEEEEEGFGDTRHAPLGGVRNMMQVFGSNTHALQHLNWGWNCGSKSEVGVPSKAQGVLAFAFVLFLSTRLRLSSSSIKPCTSSHPVIRAHPPPTAL